MDHNHSNHDYDTTTPEIDVITDSLLKLLADSSTRTSNIGDHGDHFDDSAINANKIETHNMMVYFHFGYNETILFNFWKTNSIIMFVVSCILIFLIATFYEGLKALREVILRQAILKQEKLNTEKTDSIINNELVIETKITSENTESQETNCRKFKIDFITSERILWFNLHHLVQMLLHMLQTLISFLIMLIFMTYNIWLCFSVVIGAGFGYLLFSYKRLTTIDSTTICH